MNGQCAQSSLKADLAAEMFSLPLKVSLVKGTGGIFCLLLGADLAAEYLFSVLIPLFSTCGITSGRICIFYSTFIITIIIKLLV